CIFILTAAKLIKNLTLSRCNSKKVKLLICLKKKNKGLDILQTKSPQYDKRWRDYSRLPWPASLKKS
ncbi:MAG: hypothetical protein LBV48_00280, partial [Mycoplasmataceae bacterium]|nr:hypothetical protein [Mycoplasmataceae bacterium]